MSPTHLPTRRLRAVGLLVATVVLAGCAVSEDDLRRWETTLEGPKRLSAVILHEKYPHDLRVKAALALIHMKARKGQRVGIQRLVLGALTCDPAYVEKKKGEPCHGASLTPEAREKIVADLVPRIIDELKKEPPKATQGDKAPADPSFVYKDAAYMMLTNKTQIIADQALRKRLLKALTDWAMADFDRRLNDRAQMFGMEQLLRYIGPESVEGLPALMDKDSRSLAQMASLVAKLGNKATKEAASKKLVEIVRYIASPQWSKDKAPELKAANEKAGFKVEGKQFDQQLGDYQNETTVRIFGSMKAVGGAAVVDYCLSVAQSEKEDQKRRQTALAAIGGHLDPKDDKAIERLFALAKGEKAPAVLVDAVFRLVKEMPRKKVVAQLYSFFEHKDWQVRRLAAATILAMSKVEHIDEFLATLSEKASKNFALPEARTYGAYIADFKDGKPLDKLEKHMGKGNVRARLTALSYWMEKGTKKELGKVKPYLDDKQAVPKCDEDANCSYECIVGEGKKAEKKEVKTVGDFVTYCVVPQMERNQPAKPKDAKDGAKEKKDEKGDNEGE